MMTSHQGGDTGVFQFSDLLQQRLKDDTTVLGLHNWTKYMCSTDIFTCCYPNVVQGPRWSGCLRWSRARNPELKRSPTNGGPTQAEVYFHFPDPFTQRPLSRARERVIPPSTSSGSSSSDEEVEEERAVSSRGRLRRPNPRLFD